MENSNRFASLLGRTLMVAVALSTVGGCAGDGDAAGDLPPGLAEAMKAQEETLKKNTITLRKGEEQVIEKAGEFQLSGPYSGNPLVGYDLIIKTGAVQNAGTDANVFVTLWSNGSGSWVGARFRFDNPNKNDFEYGAMDDFHPRGVDLGGKINYIQVEHDNTGNKPGWYLEYINTNYLQGSAGSSCPFNRWLATDSYPNTTNAETNCY